MYNFAASSLRPRAPDLILVGFVAAVALGWPPLPPVIQFNHATHRALAALAGNSLAPLWWPAAEIGLVIAAGCYGRFALGAVSGLRALYALLAPVLLLLGLAISAALASGRYLPTAGLALTWLAAGVLGMAAAASAANRRAQLATIIRLSFDYAAQLIRTERYSEALDVLRTCPAAPGLTARLYELGLTQARRGRWKGAIAAWEHLQTLEPGYRDVPERLAYLQRQLCATSAGPKAANEDAFTRQGAALGATQALPEQNDDGRRLGRFELLRELGRGASSTVYLAYDPQVGGEIALKVLNQKRFAAEAREIIKRQFMQEATAAGRLAHPYIAALLDVGEVGSSLYIALELAPGEPLSLNCHTGKLLAPDEAFRVALAIAEALDCAHHAGVVHGDIKPGNVLYQPEPYAVKVADFGLARLLDRQGNDGRRGSPLYMAPELFNGAPPAPAADLFALGVTFYQLLCGELPFAGHDLSQLSYDITYKPHRSVRQWRPELPSSATRITNRLLQKAPGDRFESAGAAADAIRAALERDWDWQWRPPAGRAAQVAERLLPPQLVVPQ